jgi:hypothetical protein
LGLLLLQEIFEMHAEARTEVLKVAPVGGAAAVFHTGSSMGFACACV